MKIRSYHEKMMAKTLAEMKEDIGMMIWAMENSPDDLFSVMDRYHGHLKHHMQQISYFKTKMKSCHKRNLTKETT